jgi:UDP-N-acetylmuramoyl-tripeptide--D-alanyl-D-alanine ligase
MIALSTADIAVVTGGATDVTTEVTGIATDSRDVRAGDLFVALAGTRANGGAFVDAALAAGAAAALVPRDNEGPRRVHVDDPLLALGRIAALVRERSTTRVVGITGSTGKTSTKDVLRALLEPHVRVVASLENQNNELGVPLTVCRTEGDTEVVVVEMAMRALGEIAYLAEIARPDVAVITSVGPVHLELLGTIERVAQAKAEILHHLTPGGVAVVPAGEPLLAPHLAAHTGRVVEFGETDDADVRLVSFSRNGGGGEAEIAVHGRTLMVPVNFTSRHDALNLTAAAAVYDALGLPVDEIVRGAGSVRFSRWRGEEIELPGGGLLIADCYNANPTSMAAALRHLADVADGRRTVAVIGDMAELGRGGPAHHEEVGALAADLGIGLVVAVGELARGDGGIWFATRDDALEQIGDVLEPGDVVLVKGSRSMGLETIVEAVAP